MFKSDNIEYDYVSKQNQLNGDDKKNIEITPDMQPELIAEIISAKIISNIKEDMKL
ncbi:MAG: hypothetical protein GVY19_14345 [Bacteroidetes bacterium]|jgi:hypothetical protein|nr:hypothetical protein [Bacteroidota bacterium]